MRRSLLVLAAAGALVALPSTAPAQTPAPDPGAGNEPEAPSAPGLVLSGRSLRMTRTGVVGIKMGCRANASAGEACIGSVTVRLTSKIVVDVPPPRNRPNGRSRKQVVAPFNMGVIDFTVVIGDSAEVRVRLSRRAQDLIRRQGRIRVDLIANYNSRAGAAGSARRNVRVYFPTRP